MEINTPKVSIVINNYNYQSYVCQAIESTLHQTYHNIEVLLIDDGSTDNSLQIIRQNFGDNPLVKIISKANGGQLSTFNEAIKHISGDYIFFLDADDLYKSTYIESVIQIYQKYPDVDFIFCALEKFYLDGSTERYARFEKSQNLGFSTLETLLFKVWLGSETSAISLSTKLFKQIFPIHLESDWIVRADDCLVWGASLAGAKKYFLDKALVSYRIHSTNHFIGNAQIQEIGYQYKRMITVERFFSFMKKKLIIPDSFSSIEHFNQNSFELLMLEYDSRELKSPKLLKKYLKLILKSEIKLKHKIRFMKRYLFT